jgi:hypothetical protein
MPSGLRRRLERDPIWSPLVIQLMDLGPWTRRHRDPQRVDLRTQDGQRSRWETLA